MPDREGVSPDDLQFQKAEFVSPVQELHCIFCKGGIADTYYQVAGAVACPACAEQRRLFQQSPERQGTFLKATLYGVGAAVAGSALYALVSLTGFQFSIVAILVGVMVGKAIRHVTGARSSRRYQLLAVFLTYGAITTSYLPSIIAASAKQRTKVQAADNAAPQPPPPAQRTFHPVRFVRALALLAAFTLVIPFVVLFDSPASGLLNLFIIGIGLLQAWRLTRPVIAPILGPYSMAQRNAG